MNDDKEKPYAWEDRLSKIFNQKFGHKKEGELVGYRVLPPKVWPPFDENGDFIEPVKIPVYCKKEWE